MPARGDGFWRLLPAVRAAERPRFAFFFGLATLITLAQTLGLAGSEALFLGRVGVAYLPHTFILAAVASVVGLLLYSAVVGVMRNDLLCARMLLLAGLALAGGALAAASGQRAVLPALLGAFFLTQALFLNHFWTFASDYFDILASKRLSHLFAFGASAGGALGGGLAVALVQVAPPEALIGGWALLLLAAGLFVRIRHRSLLHWGLVELVEKDEASLVGLGLATRYLRRSRLGRTLVVAAVGMTLALFVSQYLYSSIFAAAFPTAESLAAFFGTYLALSQLGELLVGFAITPWLIRRLGVVGANVVHPLTSLASFGALAVEPALAAALLARANRDLLEDSLASPVRHLAYNAIPPRFRGQLRAFVEGIVVYAAMGVAGALLLVQHAVPPAWLVALGGAMALLYLFATLQIRREYLHTLVGGIREGRLDLADLEAQVGSWDTSRLVDAWTGVLAGGGSRAVRTAAQLAPLLAARGITAPLEEGAAHTEAQVRLACLEALARCASGVREPILLAALADPDPAIRRMAVRVLAGADAEPSGPAEGAAAPRPAPGPARRGSYPRPSFSLEIRSLAADRDPRVRAEAALMMGKEGHETLAAMARSGEPETAAAALACLPEELAELAGVRAEDGHPLVRAAALDAAARLSGAVSVRRDRLVRDLEHPDARVRAGAVAALAASALAESASFQVVARALSDPSREVRARAADALRARGEEGMRAAIPYLRSESEGGAEAAIAVVGAEPTPETRKVLVAELRRRVHLAWGDLLALHVLPQQGDIATRFLRAAHHDSVLRNQRLAFAILRALEDPSVVRSIERALRLGSPKARAAALEVLANLGDREAANLLVLLLEDSPLLEKVRHAGADVEALQDVDSAVDADRRALDTWIRLGADYYRKEGGEDVSQRETMERLLLLREVPLFARLSLHQLEAIGSVMRESHYLAGEVVFREGDPGGELYLLLEGRVRIVKDHGTPDEVILGTVEAPGYFGEMAALDDRPRSATVVVADDARLLALDGDSFKDLMLQMPEIAFEVCRELSERVRNLDARVGRGAA